MAEKNIYKVAIVGCGRISGHHCRSIASVKGMEIIAVCDLIQEKAPEKSKILGFIRRDLLLKTPW